jgi:acyl-CoA synthetase (NDP forming)
MAPEDSKLFDRQTAIEKLLKPKSIVILGMSTKPGSTGQMLLNNLLENEFAGDIYLLGRSAGDVGSLRIETDISALPDSIDLALLALPASAVPEALEQCAAKRVGGAVVLASGFAETGEAARQEQDRLGALARDAGMVVLGPNCIGFTNYLSGLRVAFVNVNKIRPLPDGTRNAVAILAQSGGLGNHLQLGLESRAVPVSHNISTGNEMDLGLGDFIDHMIEESAVRVVAIYAEHIRQPGRFLVAARKAAAAGKVLVLMHPGRSANARDAAKSHTGALAGDYEVMRVQVKRAGVVLVDTLDELLDVTEILSRRPVAASGGVGIVTFSGAFCGIAHDFCEDLGIAIPALSAGGADMMKAELPEYILPRNPLDLGTEAVKRPELVGVGVAALLQQESVGGVVISIPVTAPALAMKFVAGIASAAQTSEKPVALAVLGDGLPLPEGYVDIARAAGVSVSRSSDRALRAMAKVIDRPQACDPSVESASKASFMGREAGTQAEWAGKQLLRTYGIAVPGGALARTVDEAVQTAERIGYPVVMKAQSARLAHKTEAGGVLLNIRDEEALRHSWTVIHDNVARAQPMLELDGILIETMSAKGVELVIGARRDPEWGPVLLVGLGGIFVEALGDVKLIAADASEAEIVAAFRALNGARLLSGFRGAPPVDVEAVAKIAHAVGRMMLAETDIVEVDVNPVMASAVGEGAVALDALIVTA